MSKITEAADVDLDIILKKSQDKTWNSLLPDELQHLVLAFLPTQPLASRSKAYIVLSVFCQRLRELKPKSTKEESDASTESLLNAFASSLIQKLGETAEPDVLAGLTFFTALFQTDWQAASAILLQDGVYEILEDVPDVLPSSAPVSIALAHLLAQAAGHKTCRAVVSIQAVKWLEGKARQKEDGALRAAAAVALVKLNKGGIADAASNPLATVSPASSVGNAGGGDDDLVKLMKGLVLDSPASSPTSSIQDAVEGLAYLSADPKIKEMLSSDEKFLSRLFTVIPRRKTLWSESPDDVGMTPLYGTILIITNLCGYRPRLTEEEAQIAKLRKLAKAPSGGDPGSTKLVEVTAESMLDDNAHVLARGQKLLKAGVMDALTSAVKISESRAVRLSVGKALLSLIEDNSSRGKILQSGGAKALTTVIHGILSSAPTTGSGKSAKPQFDVADLESIQALAKLSITASPVQVFGPNAGALYDAIRPFNLMLTHPSATLLQQFEAIMALTNLSSASPESADKIAHADGLLNKVELLMLEDHTLIRRASVELVCNLVAGSEDVFDKYGGGTGEPPKRKLQVLVALCDVDDMPTRTAAGGAVATITSSPMACHHLLDLQKERGRVLAIFGQLIDPTIIPPSDHDSGVAEVDDEENSGATEPARSDEGLVHRGAMCVRNFFSGIKDDAEGSKMLAQEAQKIGLVRAMAKVFKESENRSVLRLVAEALKCMMENGITIQL
ncbi:hypothetical protein EIP91_002686 [Steccherinum ochraceum]|uniref:UNC-45/Cro1/She4 central domain-containing protein n=1 Tax=Steccherinum ochraceum TaxID=92696 RepID=A0A4R0RBN0_9APHY|nr:hypothetical protein EIP91_002686 [Steccherinum ochraceum]